MTRSSVVITVTVRECRKVRSPRSETPLCYLRLEHGAVVLGESGRVTCEAGEGVMMGGVEGTIQCDPSQRESVDELIQNPIIVSLWEVLPKDKKSKDEKTMELGHVTLDLLPLVCGEREISAGGALEGEGEGEGEVEIEVKSSQDLLNDEQLGESNVMFLRIRSLHSLPTAWSHAHSPSSHFTLSTHHPITGPPLSLTGGLMKGAESRGDHTHWAWPGGRGEGSEVGKWSVEDESGEVRGQEDIPFRRSVECDMGYVEWGMELRTWLPGSASLITTLTQSPLWPVEVVRCTPSTQGGKGKSKEEEPLQSHHGVVYLDLSPLLYPGTSRMAGAFSLHPFSDTDVVSKIKRDYRSIITSPSSPSLTTVKKTAPGKSSRRVDSQSSEDQTTDQLPTSTPHTLTSSQEERKDAREGVAYEQARSYLWAEIEIMKPLVPRRSLSTLAQRVLEYIPRRPAVPRKVGGAERALGNFRRTTSAISSSLLQEYREMGVAGGGANSEESKRQFLLHLNSSGHYHTLKDQLKHAVVGVVRERYGKRVGFSDSAHCHTFLSHLYTYLSDQIHISLTQAISLDDPPETTPTPMDFDLLKHFAQEAEDFHEFSLAERYHQERVVAAEHVAQYWFDYGVFCLLIGQMEKAEQCLRECLSLEQQMIPALLLYGMLSCIGERYEEGGEYMELATTSDPTNIVAWCMRGLFYEQQLGGRVMEEMCYGRAVRVMREKEGKTFLSRETQGDGERNVGEILPPRPDNATGDGDTADPAPSITAREGEIEATADDGGKDPNSSKVEVQPEAPPTSEAPPPAGSEGGEREEPRTAAFLQTASFLLDNHALKFAEMALAHVLSSPSHPPPLHHLLTARLHLLRQQLPQAKDCISSALQADIQSSWARSLLGHTHFQLGEFPEAREAYERCLLLQTPPPNQHSVLLHLAHIHLSEKNFSKAKEVYLRASSSSASAVSWRGVGVACYKLGELGDAESALSEANILNNRDPLTWAYLALLCMKTGRPVDAEQALKFAVKTGLETGQEVVEEIRQEMTSHSRDPAHQHIPHLLTQLTSS